MGTHVPNSSWGNAQVRFVAPAAADGGQNSWISNAELHGQRRSPMENTFICIWAQCLWRSLRCSSFCWPDKRNIIDHRRSDWSSSTAGVVREYESIVIESPIQSGFSRAIY